VAQPRRIEPRLADEGSTAFFCVNDLYLRPSHRILCKIGLTYFQLLTERPSSADVLRQRTQTVAKEGTDTRDVRSGAYDPVSLDGLPQPDQVRDKTSRHEQQQWGADVRAEALPGTAPVLPDGLRRPRKGPLNRRTGRHRSS
jgi:hypothetical protein